MNKKEEMRKRRVFNPYGFYGTRPYIWYQARGDSRMTKVPGWMVTRRGLKLGDFWEDYGSKHFFLEPPPHDPSKYTEHQRNKLGQETALKDAMAWASEKFAIKAWARDPFGGYGPAEFVTERVRAILAAPEGQDMEL
jgi:hypothetical protein